MPELRHKVTGALLSVAPEVAARLGGDWEPLGAESKEPEQEKKPAARRRASKSDDD